MSEVCEAFWRARDAAMRGGRLADEGDRDGALESVTVAIEALNEATDALERAEAEAVAA
jgi:hypothetical protein